MKSYEKDSFLIDLPGPVIYCEETEQAAVQNILGWVFNDVRKHRTFTLLQSFTSQKQKPVLMAKRSEARTVFGRSNTGIVG
jgi:hypothetical protein